MKISLTLTGSILLFYTQQTPLIGRRSLEEKNILGGPGWRKIRERCHRVLNAQGE